MVVLQGAPAGSPLRIAGTFALLALFFSLTAHLAARNVLGDVELKKAFAIGPVPPVEIGGHKGLSSLPWDMVVLQSVPSGSASQVAGTIAVLALFFSLTAHLAARNVLGDVELKKAFVIGPVFAAIGFVFPTFQLPIWIGVVLALVADFVVFKRLYGQSNRLAAYITLIHVVVSIILGVIVFGLLALLRSAPG